MLRLGAAMLCEQCAGKGQIYVTEVLGDLEVNRFVPCPYEGCVQGIVADNDCPNDGLPKGEVDERDT